MSARVNTTNRIVLIGLGLLLLAAAVLGLVLSYGGFGSARATSSVLPAQWRDYAATQDWFWWVVAGLCLVVALLGLRWVLAQLRTDRTSRLDLTSDEQDGVTTLHAGAMTDAVEKETENIAGVERAAAQMSESPRRALTLVVSLTATADISQVRDRMLSTSVPNVRAAMDEPGLPVNIELRPTSSTRRAVA